MTNDQLAAMKALEEKAGFSRWQIGDGTVNTIWFTQRDVWAPNFSDSGELVAGTKICECFQANAKDVAAFIAAARSFVPQAIAEIERLKGLAQEAYFEGSADSRFGQSDWMHSKAKRAMEEII